jgi:hypothetical protein
VEVAGVPLHADAIGLDTDGTALVGIRAQAGAHAWPHLWHAGVLTKLTAPPNTREPTGTDIAGGRVTGGARTSGPSKGVYWDHDRVPRVLGSSTEGLHINRDGMIVGSATHPDISHSVFRLGTFEHEFGTFDDHVYVGTVSDDGTFAGSAVIAGTSSAAVWRCG